MNGTIKKILSAILLSAVFATTAFGMTAPVNAAQITDLDKCAGFARPAVEYLIDKGIIIGSNGKFNPNDTLTRDQMVKMLVESMEIDISNLPEEPSFVDVAPTHWSYPYVEAALKEGIIKMNATKTFVPGQKATREQMSAMFVRALGLTDEQLLVNQTLDTAAGLADANSVSKWAQDSVEFSLDNGLMNGIGNGKFGPSLEAERQQAAVVIYRFLMSKDSLRQKQEDFSKEVQYPEFYNTIKTSIDQARFSGTVNMRILVGELGDNAHTEFMLSYNDVEGAVNGSDFMLKFDSTVKVMTEEVSLIYELISKDEEFYYKDDSMSAWERLSLEETDDMDLPATSTQDIAPDSAGFMRNYNNLNIEKDLQVVNGKTLTRYTIVLDQNSYALAGLDYIEGFVQSGNESLTDLYNNGFNLRYELFLSESSSIEREKISFKGNFIDEPAGLDLLTEMSVDLTYSDLGVDIPITAPVID